jgi:hypothetical protein
MSTMLPEEMSGGSNMEGNSIYTEVSDEVNAGIHWRGGELASIAQLGARTRRLSSVKRTATPASTLPTVSDTSIACNVGVRVTTDTC